MIKSYFKIAWRNLVKNKTFSIINITGLSFSVAFCLLLFFYIRHERSYDTFHSKKDRLFRLEMTNLWSSPKEKPKSSMFSFLSKGDDAKNTVIFPLIVGPDMKNSFPEIQNAIRFQDYGDELIKAGKDIYKEPHIVFADDNFLNSFSFHLVKGDPQTALASVNNVVLTETTAKKYFGDQDAMGKTIEIIRDSTLLYTVAGIVEDVPENSSIQFAMIVPLKSDPGYVYNVSERFNHSTHLCMIELANNVSVSQFEQKLNKWSKSYFTEYFGYFKDINVDKFHLYLRPMVDCHYNASGIWGHYTDIRSIYQLACLAVIILLLASLNYILLAISNAAARSQEVGLRKVVGAGRKTIILQFWAETQVVTVISVLAGLILAYMFLPLFNSAIGSKISLNYFSWKEIISVLFILCLVLGILAGLYPAWQMSAMRPLSIIKNFSTFKINPRISKILVVLQYTACVTLMIAAFIINRQMNYVSNKNLGFDKEQVLVIDNPTYDFGFTKRLRERLYNYAQSQPYITQYSAMSGGLDGGGNRNGFKLNGEQKWLTQVAVDYNYFEMLGLKFVQGRPFSKQITSDTSKKVRPSIVNETLFNMLGKEAKLGVYNETIRSTIIGVVKDYHFETLSKKIEPEQHVLSGGYVGSFLFKIKPGQMKYAIAQIGKEWKEITGNYPFEYTFLDQDIAKMYEADIRGQKTIQASCFFAMLIACMGLFGLSAINAANRTKEIGIRKVLGADVKDIVTSLSANFLVLVAISVLIAVPISWWMMNKWLEDFAYRINISWWMPAVVGTMALLIALATVSLHAVKAAIANPVKSLRTE